MAFTRSFLKASGLTDEQISAVMEEHIALVNPLKEERDRYKAEAEQLPGLQKQLEESKGGEDFRKKYEDEHQAFEDYKTKVKQDAEAAEVRAAYRKLLVEEKISEKRIDTVMKCTDFSGITLDKSGNIQDADKRREAIRSEWADFITKEEKRGAGVETPPEQDKNTFETLSLAEKMTYANQHPTDPAVQAWLKK